MTYTLNGKQYLVIAAGGTESWELSKVTTCWRSRCRQLFCTRSVGFFLPTEKSSECAARGCAAGPGPLKIETAQMAGHVDHLADKK